VIITRHSKCVPSYKRRAAAAPTATNIPLPRIWTDDAPLPQYLTGTVGLVPLPGGLQLPVGLAQKVEVEVSHGTEPGGGCGGEPVGGEAQDEEEQVGLGMAPL
jgi:hypothetical protein